MLVSIVSLNAQTVRTDNMGRDLKPTGKGFGERDTTPVDSAATGTILPPANGISYHGGPVMTSTKNIYYIWYGTWSSTAKSILTNLAQTEGGSPYFNINTTYHNGSGTAVSNSISYKSSTTNNYVQ